MEKKVFTCESCDDLMGFAAKVDALGTAVNYLSHHDSEFFGVKGEGLGDIISDYGKAINEVLDGLYHTIEKVFQHGDTSLISELNTTKRKINEGFMGLHGNLGLIKEAIEKADQFLNDDLQQIVSIKKEFQKTGEAISKQLMGNPEGKGASATPASEAKAPDTDH